MAKRKKKQRQRKPKVPLAPPRFDEGMAVRVKVGTMDEDYPRYPLGRLVGPHRRYRQEQRRTAALPDRVEHLHPPTYASGLPDTLRPR